MGLGSGAISVLAICAGLVAGALVVMLLLSRARTDQALAKARALLQGAKDDIVFIFDDTQLLDGTALARDFLSTGDPKLTDFERLASLLSARFPDFRERCMGLMSEGHLRLHPADDSGGEIEMEHWYGFARIQLHPQSAEADNRSVVMAEAMAAELDVLRSLSDSAPILIWRQENDGTLGWANNAYVELADQVSGMGEAQWPPKPLFDGIARPVGRAPVVEQSWLRTGGNVPPRCFEITSVLRDGGVMHFAVDVTEIQRAESARHQFVQTLSKTFAQLSVGLAVFDRSRRLVTFNPALIDLLRIPTDILISRPTLPSFLDRLREARLVPEPKDFNSWRQDIAALEAGAENGNYEEIWDLPNGLTFKVSGRPHPDGAIAFLFEDISDELALTRRFRSQIDLNQDVLDTLPEAIAVFSASGVMQLSNRAYRNLWDSEGHLSLHGASLTEERANWKADDQLVDDWLRSGEGSISLRTADGTPCTATVNRLARGAVMIRFIPSVQGAARLTLSA